MKEEEEVMVIVMLWIERRGRGDGGSLQLLSIPSRLRSQRTPSTKSIYIYMSILYYSIQYNLYMSVLLHSGTFSFETLNSVFPTSLCIIISIGERAVDNIPF